MVVDIYISERRVNFPKEGLRPSCETGPECSVISGGGGRRRRGEKGVDCE
jgi:hypothetical protein